MEQQYLDLLLVMKESEYLTSQQLADELSVSSKTIQKRLKEMDSLLREYGALIEVKHRAGYRLQIRDRDAFNRLSIRPSGQLPATNAGRVDYILKRLIESSDYLRLSDLEEELYVSYNTVSACMKQVEQVLGQHSLSLHRRAKYGIKIQGTEFRKRQFVTEYFRKEELLEHGADAHRSQRLSAYVHKVLREQDFSISDFALRNLIIHLYVAIERIEQEQYISGQTLQMEQLKNQPEYRVAEKLVRNLEQELAIDIPEPEIAYITIHLAGKRMQQENDVDNVVIGRHISEIVDDMLAAVHQRTHFDFREDLELKMALCQHLVALEVRAKYGMELKNPLLEEVRQGYPTAFALAVEASGVLNQRFETRLSEHEISYIAFSFALAQERRETEFIAKKNVLLVCSTGKGSAKLLQYKYEKEFGKYLNELICCDLTELAEVDFAEIDYVITTVPIPVKIPRPIMEVQYFLDQNEISRLRAVLFSKQEVGSVLDYYSPELFIPDLKAGSREEVLRKMVSHIEQYRQLPPDFLELIERREQTARTEFGNLVAMPHPEENVTDRTFVCVAVLEQPIIWETQKVQVVFLVSVEKELNQSIQPFYKATAEFLLGRESIRGLIKHRSYQWFESEMQKMEDKT